MANQIIGIGSYEVLKGMYDEITKLTNDMVDQVKNAKSIVNKINNADHWKGKGYDNYNKKFNALASNFGALCNEMYKLNNNINSSIERYKVADAQAAINQRNMQK